MLLSEVNSNSIEYSFWEVIISASTFILTLATLIITSRLNYRSAKAAERSATSSEESAKFAKESMLFAEQSAKSATEAIKISEKSAEIASQTLNVQREHNIKSVTPLLQVQSLSHDEEVSVKLTNNGIGPLIIRNLVVTNGVESNSNLINWMPVHPKGITYWITYKQTANGLSIAPQTSVPLIFLGNEDENFPDYVLYRAFVRRNLSKLTMTIEGQDIYNNAIPTQTINFIWLRGFISKWFLDNFPDDFANDFNLNLKTAKYICSVEEWDEKVEVVRRNHTPNRLSEEHYKSSNTNWTVN